ncbi:Gfo/Idh/MocA family oxidoreductase [Bacillus sporothermodurans]|uniref:Gfo/Idh/MocA family protein n=1 Tax=Heyndrickxia sporothermodurans TaxID=46224 RepID=UPI00192B3BDA|nr:Gfo/Idh/MocA family oxidoreductase [Heyndrickxia sporothermodurans]MBL5818326.1 Gfo/Idh/MocA family oxidoreductase [Heyndrickxia sporothermodurans]
MSKIKLGIVGVGGIAVDRHIPAFLRLNDDVSIEAVCDVNFIRAQEVAESFGIPHAYNDYREMFTVIDAVVICTPNKFHSEITVAALNSGLHVLCEKPMAMTVEECQAMIDASKKAEKVLSIGFHYRFMKESQGAKRIMVAKEIGHPLVVRIQALRRRKVPGWGVFTNKDLQGGGSLIDYGCHLLDLSLWLMGNPNPVEVSGTTYHALSNQPGQVNQWGNFNHETFNVDDHVTGYVRFANGASMLLEVSWSANIESDKESVSISGDQGGIEVFPLKLNYAKHGMLFNSDATLMPETEDPGYLQAKNFVDVILNRAEQIVKPKEALQVSQIMEAIYKSSENQKSVQL